MSAGFQSFNQVGGDCMAYSRLSGKPWHGLGTALAGLATAEEMIQAAKLDWQVELKRNHFQKSDGTYSESASNEVIRMDSEASLGTVGMRYTPVQNTQIFSFFDNIVEIGEAIYETAGSLHGGKKVWVLAKLPENSTIMRNGKPDITEKYILLSNAHDGTQAVRCYFTPVRVVCQNTLTASAGQASNCTSVRHTVSAEIKLKEAHSLMGFVTKYYEEVELRQRYMANSVVPNFESLMAFMEELWPDTTAEKSRAHKKREEALMIYNQERKEWGGDWLSALNAVTGTVDHSQKALGPGNTENRMDKIIFGSGAQLKDKAFELALKYSGYKEAK